MSTKSGIWNDDDWYLYEEMMDDGWHVYLEFPRAALQDLETLRIPVAVWAKVRQHTSGMEQYLSQPRDALRAEAEKWVDERAKDIADGKTFARFRGAFTADAGWPREKQIEAYMQERTPPAGGTQ